MNSITTDEIKKIQLDILLAVDRFCKDNNIDYYLCGGTLLGAVRHKGFIPWDDDIDIQMKRNDYERFIVEFDHPIYKTININNTSNYYLSNTKVIDSRTFLIEEVKKPIPLGVFIDIFPLDQLPNNRLLLRITNAVIAIFRRILLVKNISNSAQRSTIKNSILSIGYWIFKPITNKTIITSINCLSQLFNNSKASNIACISSFSYGLKEVVPATDYAYPVDCQFEGYSFSAPNGYENILKSWFGDYMILPPKEKQVSHHNFKAYWI